MNDGEISEAASELVSESRRVFSYQQSALGETRTVPSVRGLPPVSGIEREE